MRILKHTFFASLFGLVFQATSLTLAGSAFVEFYRAYIVGDVDFMVAMITFINTYIIALAMFELGVGVYEEYQTADTDRLLYPTMQRTITRFVGTVCIALVLEALIMVIKYSELESARKLWYPIGIIVGSSLLLSSLALFMFLTRDIKSPPED